VAQFEIRRRRPRIGDWKRVRARFAKSKIEGAQKEEAYWQTSSDSQLTYATEKGITSSPTAEKLKNLNGQSLVNGGLKGKRSGKVGRLRRNPRGRKTVAWGELMKILRVGQVGEGRTRQRIGERSGI